IFNCFHCLTFFNLATLANASPRHGSWPTSPHHRGQIAAESTTTMLIISASALWLMQKQTKREPFHLFLFAFLQRLGLLVPNEATLLSDTQKALKITRHLVRLFRITR